MDHPDPFMALAIAKAHESLLNGGGPFGAVVVRNGTVVSAESNHVTQALDPTAHAEVSAIRAACQTLGTFDLSDCEIYTSCEPCPMCLGAIYWARLKKIWFAASREDAAAAGFDDRFIYQQISLPFTERSIPLEQLDRPLSLEVFRKWIAKEDKTPY